MTDIVAELRQRHRNTTGLDPRITNPIVGPTIFLEAADEIDRKNLTIQALTEERDEVVRMANQLTAERDEARRMYCEEAFCHRFNERRFNERCVPSPISNARQIAHNMKWDCFKEASDE